MSFNFVKQFGPNVAIVGVDIRAERTKKQILSRATWEMVFARISSLPQSVTHVVVVLTVPILYPKVRSWYIIVITEGINAVPQRKNLKCRSLSVSTKTEYIYLHEMCIFHLIHLFLRNVPYILIVGA